MRMIQTILVMLCIGLFTAGSASAGGYSASAGGYAGEEGGYQLVKTKCGPWNDFCAQPNFGIQICGPWNNFCGQANNGGQKCGKWNNWCGQANNGGNKCGPWNNFCGQANNGGKKCGKWNNWCGNGDGGGMQQGDGGGMQQGDGGMQQGGGGKGGGMKKDANVMAAQCRAKGMGISGIDDNFAYCSCDSAGGLPSARQECVQRNGAGAAKLPR